uniref:Putative secreted protein n=1 Tax=Anopheles darlingi TaxID=43151 RepID=A0A2M4DAY4_ANODA
MLWGYGSGTRIFHLGTALLFVFYARCRQRQKSATNTHTQIQATSSSYSSRRRLSKNRIPSVHSITNNGKK